MGGVSRETGAPLSGWPHVVQSIQTIMQTRFGERVMREWFGSDIPKLLGENAIPETFVSFYAATLRALTVKEINDVAREPRFRITSFVVHEVTREGEAFMTITGVYIPRALLGDMTPETTPRTITITRDGIAGVL
ncbi:MAG: GPW/gp25 family protein [Beijerinckiaceae bacterium]